MKWRDSSAVRPGGFIVSMIIPNSNPRMRKAICGIFNKRVTVPAKLLDLILRVFPICLLQRRAFDHAPCSRRWGGLTWSLSLSLSACRFYPNSTDSAVEPPEAAMSLHVQPDKRIAPFAVNAQERPGRVDESRATTSTHPALCSRPGETKGPLEAVSIHYRSTSLPRFVAVAGEVPKRNGHRAQ